MHAKMLSHYVVGSVKHQIIKILDQHIMFFLIFGNQQQVQYILIILFGNLNREKLLVLIAENIDIKSDLPLKFTIIILYTNRELVI